MKKSFKEVINDGIDAEKTAILYYTSIYPYIHNGSDRRSILHILNEEKDHLKILEKIRERY